MAFNNFSLHFRSKKQSFDINFQKQKRSSKNTVLIDGKNYKLQGDEFKIAWIKVKLPELTQSGLTFEKLKSRLINLGAKNISTKTKVHTLGIDSLGSKITAYKRKSKFRETKEVGNWMKKELASLESNKLKVARKYMSTQRKRFKEIADTKKLLEHLKKQKASMRQAKNDGSKESSITHQIDINEKRLKQLQAPDSGLIEFLEKQSPKPKEVKRIFSKAITEYDEKLFLSLFKNLTSAQVHIIDSHENLKAIPVVPLHDSPVTLTKKNIQDIQDYMRDLQFSGVVTISDGKTTHTISSDNIKDPNTPFAIHSIGKVFTGVLVLRMIEEGIISEATLNQPIQLSQQIIDALPTKVRQQLPQTTLLQVMLHRGRYGDYLQNYLAAIKDALDEGIPPPRIDTPEKFLNYADKELVNLSPSGDAYSNLGLLLVGLSIKHLYNSNQGKHLDYYKILHHYVLAPAGIKTFKTHMPKNGCFNADDKTAPHIVGGPAGGYWSTTNDLLNIAIWLKEKSHGKNFMELLVKYGGEFFNNREIGHSGSIDSASAHLSHSLDNNFTIAIVSNTEGLGLASILSQAIQENILSTKAPLKRDIKKPRSNPLS